MADDARLTEADITEPGNFPTSVEEIKRRVMAQKKEGSVSKRKPRKKQEQPQEDQQGELFIVSFERENGDVITAPFDLVLLRYDRDGEHPGVILELGLKKGVQRFSFKPGKDPDGKNPFKALTVQSPSGKSIKLRQVIRLPYDGEPDDDYEIMMFMAAGEEK